MLAKAFTVSAHRDLLEVDVKRTSMSVAIILVRMEASVGILSMALSVSALRDSWAWIVGITLTNA